MEFSWQESWSGLPFFLQGIFQTQGLNPGLLHCRQILHHLSHQGKKDPSVQFSRSVVSDSLWPHGLFVVCQTSLSITNSQSLLKLMSIESVMPSNHLILCHPFLLLPSIFSSIRVSSNKEGRPSVQISSVDQSCLTFCDPMDCSTPGLPIHHQFPEFTRTHVHWVGDAIQPSHPLSFPSPPAFTLSQHQGLSNETVLHIRWPKFRSFSFSISPSSEYSGLISFRMDWLVLLAVQGTLKSLLQHYSKKHQFFGDQLSL